MKNNSIKKCILDMYILKTEALIIMDGILQNNIKGVNNKNIKILIKNILK